MHQLLAPLARLTSDWVNDDWVNSDGSVNERFWLQWLAQWPHSNWLILMARLTSDWVNDDEQLKLQHCSWRPLLQVGLGLVGDHLKLRRVGLVRDHLKLGLVRDWCGLCLLQQRQQLGTMQGTPRSL